MKTLAFKHSNLKTHLVFILFYNVSNGITVTPQIKQVIMMTKNVIPIPETFYTSNFLNQIIQNIIFHSEQYLKPIYFYNLSNGVIVTPEIGQVTMMTAINISIPVTIQFE